MLPASVCRVLFSGHAYLREQCARVERLAFESGQEHDDAVLREAVVSLCNSVLGHLDVEESLVCRDLARGDLGRESLADLQSEHDGQRVRLRLVRSGANDARSTRDELCESAIALIADLRDEMLREEAAILGESPGPMRRSHA